MVGIYFSISGVPLSAGKKSVRLAPLMAYN